MKQLNQNFSRIMIDIHSQSEGINPSVKEAAKHGYVGCWTMLNRMVEKVASREYFPTKTRRFIRMASLRFCTLLASCIGGWTVCRAVVWNVQTVVSAIDLRKPDCPTRQEVTGDDTKSRLTARNTPSGWQSIVRWLKCLPLRPLLTDWAPPLFYFFTRFPTGTAVAS